jgi:Tol biopolymer transport system component
MYKIDIQTGEATTIDPPFDRSLSLRDGPVWAKDGKRFFYTAGLRSEEKRYIHTYDLETGKNERLPGSPGDACFIAISPDGKWLAFVNEQGKKVLRIMPSSGGEPREIHSYEHKDTVITPAWSADGSHIYIPKLRDPKGNIWDLYRVSRDGGNAEKIDLGMYWVRYLTVHPDGRHLAFSSAGANPLEMQVWVMENFLPAGKK